MTYSILARDPGTGEIGGAVATGTPSAGGFVLHMAAGIGAIATQGFSTNTLYGPHGLRLMEDGQDAETVLRTLTEADAGRDHRQIVVMDHTGAAAGWTGAANVEPMAHLCAPGLAVAANWVASGRVAGAMRDAFVDSAGAPLEDRLLAALEAGEAEGGDARGIRSAALRIVSRDRPPVDIRADYDDRPIRALREIARHWAEPGFRAFLDRLPTLEAPHRH